MAKLCDAGPRINKSFDWTTIIKAAIDVAYFYFFFGSIVRCFLARILLGLLLARIQIDF